MDESSGFTIESPPQSADYDFVLPDSTHKQDDRAYVKLVKGGPDDEMPTLWKYFVVRPPGVDGRDYETVVDADEAFAIVQRKNKLLRRQYAEAQAAAATADAK